MSRGSGPIGTCCASRSWSADRGCRYPGCDAPIDDCQIDHTTPAARGGATSDANGRAYCGPHNRARNHPNHVEPAGDDDADEPPSDDR